MSIYKELEDKIEKHGLSLIAIDAKYYDENPDLKCDGDPDDPESWYLDEKEILIESMEDLKNAENNPATKGLDFSGAVYCIDKNNFPVWFTIYLGICSTPDDTYWKIHSIPKRYKDFNIRCSYV